MKLDDNHIIYQAPKRIRALIRPLKQIAQIHFFCYAVNYPDGSGFCLLSHPELYECVFENQYPLTGFHFEKGWSTWNANMPQDEFLELKKLNISNGVCNIVKTNHKTELFEFATINENHQMYDFCLNNRHVLKKFSAYFLREATDLIEIAHQQRAVIPPAMREPPPSKIAAPKMKLSPDALALLNYPLNLMSARERKCFQLLLNGYSNTEISKIFNLSSKTIDSYVARIKCKLNCKNKVSLIQAAKEMGIVEHTLE